MHSEVANQLRHWGKRSRIKRWIK